MSTFVRLGMRPNCELFRYALLLRSDEFLEQRLGNGAWVKCLSAAANLLVVRRNAPRVLPGLEIAELTGPFGDEFSRLDQQISSTGTIRASRSAELLNWRYWDHPDKVFRVLVARKAGELLGYLAFSLYEQEERAYIADLFGLQMNATGPALLEAAANICRKRKLSSLHGFCSGDSDLKSIFEGVGFRCRDIDSRVVAYENPLGPDKVLNGLRWNFGRAEQMI
jgi:hypothetical protein